MTEDAPAPVDAPSPDTGRRMTTLAASLYGIVALFALGFALFGGRLGGLFGERAPTAAGIVAALGLGAGLVALTRVAARAWPPFQRTTRLLAELLGPVTWPWALLLALLSGFSEELLFRGALWPHLGLLGTTLLFGLVHVIPKRTLIWVYPLFATVAGLLLGLLREGTQSLWPPVIAHATVNAANLVWLGRLARGRADAPGP